MPALKQPGQPPFKMLKRNSKPAEKKQKTDKASQAADVGPREFRIGFLVHDVSRMRRNLFDSQMRPLGLTRSQWWVLAQLSRNEHLNGHTGMLQTELARILDVGKVTIGGLIDRLEAGGFVKRSPDSVDRRAKRIMITQKGDEVLSQMVSIGRRLNVFILDGISEKDVKTAERVLAEMKINLRNAMQKLKVTDSDDEEP